MGLLFNSCSTKKNTWLSRNYHQLTTHYNGWFYANEIINESVDKVKKAYKDDFEKILPLYIHGTIEDGKKMTPDMEKAFKKLSTCIGRHDMLIKDVQHNPWVFDCFILVGKTHFYKHDYFAGLEAFEYVSARNKKKPIRYEAMMWMLRTYNETGLFSSSQGLIDMLAEDKKIPKKYLKEYLALVADFHIKTENYKAASKALTKAIALRKKSSERTRFMYILAQLYQRQNNDDMAYEYFERTLKNGPPNEMAFNAKMNMATSFTAGKGKKDVKKVLAKMLKDEKYIDFKDQLYFALAKIYFKENNRAEEEKCLVQSVALSKKNNRQKGVSAQRLGELYLEQSKFELAEAYYDTAAASLPKDYYDYVNVMVKKNNLNNLIKYKRTITEQDSLLKIANMGEKEREQFVEKMIEKLKEKEEKEKEELERMQNSNQGIFTATQSENQQQPASGVAWYFYNPAMMGVGYADFQKKWGNRKLEDNWRRSVKPASNIEDPAAGGQPAADGSQAASGGGSNEEGTATFSNVKSKEYYLKNLPLSDSAKTASRDKVINAYYDMGLLYREQLNDNKHAAESFEELNKKYSGNKYELQCYYQLYRIYTLLDETALAEKFKNIILDKYGNTEYAMLIKNPEYGKDRDYKLNQAELFYQNTYESFSSGNYEECLSRCIAADSLYPKTKYKPMYDMLKALSKGKMEGKEVMLASLKEVSALHPSHKIKGRADELVVLLSGGKVEEKNDSAANKNSIYNFNPNSEHFLVLMIPLNRDLNLQKGKISDFNASKFQGTEFFVTDALFGKDKKMITVKQFENKDKALRYLEMFTEDKSITEGMSSNQYELFLISTENYLKLFKEQKTDDYKTFFDTHYIEKKVK